MEERVRVKRTSIRATRGGVWELWVRGLDFRLGKRLENSIAFTVIWFEGFVCKGRRSGRKGALSTLGSESHTVYDSVLLLHAGSWPAQLSNEPNKSDRTVGKNEALSRLAEEIMPHPAKRHLS